MSSDTPLEVPPIPRATGSEKAAWILTGAGLLFAFYYALVPGLLVGLLTYTLLQKATGLVHHPRVSRGAAKLISAVVLVLVAGGATTAIVLFLIGFVRGQIGDLPALFQKVADIIDQARTQLRSLGIEIPLDELLGGGSLQGAISEWLRRHSAELTHAGSEVGRFLVHALMGFVVGLLIFFRHQASGPPRPLSAAFGGRIRRFAQAFESVVIAQVEISVVNTGLTALYLFVVLPLAGRTLPLSGTLLVTTFLAGLLPVVGNLISNSAVVVISLDVSLSTAVLSLAFLIAVHKLEYFLNARIVGSRIGAAAWETLLAIVAFEVAFGLPGVVLAPIVYAYVKRELSDRRLV